MLKDALARLLVDKNFESISVQDIAEESTLNRATFYDHYPDKIALLNCLVAERFHEAVRRRQLCFNGCTGATGAMFMGICDYFRELPGSGIGRAIENSQESIIVSIVRGMVGEGISRHMPSRTAASELLVASVAWAIYGAAREWIQDARGVSIEEAATIVGELINAMMMQQLGPMPTKETPQ